MGVSIIQGTTQTKAFSLPAVWVNWRTNVDMNGVLHTLAGVPGNGFRRVFPTA